eukprot:TRINITY_DN31992_c0_g1_i1.p2 TRINITY_DN31992_c0_g1~~TRINITY_DN31992_c0_g1_i1.p2  ORF type:complete len:135 (+),score=15.41 TRINITY_DN31992_c0_g1_i1:283-687(+)
MTHQDFEKYALEKPMEGGVSENFKKIFFKYLNYKKKNLKVLDSGCGDGKYFDFLRSYFEQENIFGVEVSEKRIERCHKKDFLMQNTQIKTKDYLLMIHHLTQSFLIKLQNIFQKNMLIFIYLNWQEFLIRGGSQ